MAAALRLSLRRSRLFCTTTTTPAAATDTTTDLITAEVKAKFRSERDADKALEMYKNLPDTGISPFARRFALGHAVGCLAKAGRQAEIETLIESHKNDPKITEVEYFAGLIRSYGIAGMLDQALQLFNQREELGVPQSCFPFNALLNAYKQAKKYDQVVKLFDEIPQRDGFSPDRVSYSVLIKSLCELNLPESAILRLKEMEEKNVELGNIVYTTVLDALYKKGKVDEGDKIWKEMIEKGCSPDVVTYNVRVMHCAYNKKPEDVLALMEEMKTAGINPDTITYNHLFISYFRNAMVEDALEAYEEIEKSGCTPNSATFKMCLSYLCKNRQFKKAYEIWKESNERNIFPPFPVLKIMVKGLAESPKRKMAAKEVITTMKEKAPEKLLDAWNALEAELDLSKDEGSPVAVSA